MEGTRQLEQSRPDLHAAAPRTGRLGVWLFLCWAVLVGVQIVTPLWYATPDACSYLSIGAAWPAASRRRTSAAVTSSSASATRRSSPSPFW